MSSGKRNFTYYETVKKVIVTFGVKLDGLSLSIAANQWRGARFDCDTFEA
jgi:hypothetical protein